MKKLANFIFFIVGALLGYALCNFLSNEEIVASSPLNLGIFAAAGGIFLLVTKPLWTRLFKNITKQIESYFKNISTAEVWAGIFGLIIGLIIANLIARPVIQIPIVGVFLAVVINIAFGYWGIILALKKRDEIYKRILSVFGGPEAKDNLKHSKIDKKTRTSSSDGIGKILDTSVIIDGRILDIARSGFIDGTLIVPCFVLDELQHIADSSDLLKRNRGRRGLDILNLIRQDSSLNVKIDETNFDEFEVDAKLLRLASLTGHSIVTNDLNLNKVASLREVTVLNINDLANALKPVVLPGEDMVVQILKDGKEIGQGVAYLEDGTMIVVEGGKKKIGETVTVEVTSVLQTSAGKMIFAKLKFVD